MTIKQAIEKAIVNFKLEKKERKDRIEYESRKKICLLWRHMHDAVPDIRGSVWGGVYC